MNLQEVLDVIDSETATVDLLFTEKSIHGYSSFQAEIENGHGGVRVINSIKGLVSGTIQSINDENLEIVDYNPMGVRDDTLELTNYDYVGNYQDIVASFDEVETENLENNADNLTFYTLVFRANDVEV